MFEFVQITTWKWFRSKLNPSVEFERTKTYQSLIAASIKRSEAKQKIVEVSKLLTSFTNFTILLFNSNFSLNNFRT